MSIDSSRIDTYYVQQQHTCIIDNYYLSCNYFADKTRDDVLHEFYKQYFVEMSSVDPESFYLLQFRKICIDEDTRIMSGYKLIEALHNNSPWRDVFSVDFLGSSVVNDKLEYIYDLLANEESLANISGRGGAHSYTVFHDGQYQVRDTCHPGLRNKVEQDVFEPAEDALLYKRIM